MTTENTHAEAPLLGLHPVSDGAGLVTVEVVGSIGSFGPGSGSVEPGRLHSALLTARAHALAGRADRAAVLIDSPGGAMAPMADITAAAAALADACPTVAMVRGMACSAAYLIAAQAHRITATATSLVGSLGVMTVMTDASEAARRSGVRVVPVTGQARKADNCDGVPVTDEAVADAARINAGLLDEFAGAIARGRPAITRALIEGWNGAVFVGRDAMARGLVDAVAPTHESLRTLAGAAGLRS